MKTARFFLSAALVAMAAATANAQISTSAHNFSSMAWSGGEICKPCHTPHFANPDAGRLWNHTLTTATYTLNNGSSGSAAVDFDKGSRLCLSCHDGTVALDSFGGMTGTSFMPAAGNLGTDMRNDHPVGSRAIYPTGTSTSYNPQDPTTHYVTFNGRTLRLRSWVDPSGVTQYVVGCRTCHDPHNRGNYGSMLQFSNSASVLCLTCHIK
jgi:predicted CXXCH cytochrome family protein